MKVHDFARRLGLPDSKVRYYDRSGLIQGGRQKRNNYRDFTDLDALHIYHANMLRCFGMGVQEALEAHDQELTVIDGWVEDYVEELEKQLVWEEMRLQRLREMREYFSMIQTRKSSLSEGFRDVSYNVWNFGKVGPLTSMEETVIQNMAKYMPFSYIAIKVSQESLLAPGEELDVSIGLGMLERNRKKLGLPLPPGVSHTPGGHLIDLLLEIHDPFSMTKQDIAPLLEEIARRKITLTADLIGRIYISYVKNGVFVHGVSLALPIGE